MNAKLFNLRGHVLPHSLVWCWFLRFVHRDNKTEFNRDNRPEIKVLHRSRPPEKEIMAGKLEKVDVW